MRGTLTFVDDLSSPNHLGFLVLLDNAFRHTASGNSLGAPTREFYVEDLKDRCLARDTLLVFGWEQACDALPDVLYDLINYF